MTKPAVGTIFLILALGLAVGGAGYLYFELTDEQAKRVWTEGQLEKMTQAKDSLEKERDELIQTKLALENQLNESTTQAQALSEQLAQEKRARQTLTTELDRSTRETTDLKSKLDGERKDKEGLTQELAKAKQSYQALNSELTILRQAKEALEKRVKEMLSARGDSAEAIVVKPEGEGASAKGKPTSGKTLEGKVLVVNREFNFVVVNLGTKDGLKTGTTITVLRGDKSIGKAEVERVYENMSAANLIQEESKGQIQDGDLVRVSS